MNGDRTRKDEMIDHDLQELKAETNVICDKYTEMKEKLLHLENYLRSYFPEAFENTDNPIEAAVLLLAGYRQSSMIYNPITQEYSIYGLRISEAVFKSWGRDGMPVGTLFRLVARPDDGVIILERAHGHSGVDRVETPDE